jgi:hypothetical protein
MVDHQGGKLSPPYLIDLLLQGSFPEKFLLFSFIVKIFCYDKNYEERIFYGRLSFEFVLLPQLLRSAKKKLVIRVNM